MAQSNLKVINGFTVFGSKPTNRGTIRAIAVRRSTGHRYEYVVAEFRDWDSTSWSSGFYTPDLLRALGRFDLVD